MNCWSGYGLNRSNAHLQLLPEALWAQSQWGEAWSLRDLLRAPKQMPWSFPSWMPSYLHILILLTTVTLYAYTMIQTSNFIWPRKYLDTWISMLEIKFLFCPNAAGLSSSFIFLHHFFAVCLNQLVFLVFFSRCMKLVLLKFTHS